MTEEVSLQRAQKRMRLKADFKWLGTYDAYEQTLIAIDEFMNEHRDHGLSRAEVAGVAESAFLKAKEQYLREV